MNTNFRHVWTIPLVLGALSLLGLIVGLVGEGLLNMISWVCLAIPLLVMGWFIGKPKSAKRRVRSSQRRPGTW